MGSKTFFMFWLLWQRATMFSGKNQAFRRENIYNFSTDLPFHSHFNNFKACFYDEVQYIRQQITYKFL